MKRNLRKTLYLLIAIILCVSMAAGCTSKQNSPQEATTLKTSEANASEAVNAEPATVKVALPVAAEEEALFSEEHKKFMEGNKNITVDFMPLPASADEYGNSIQLMFASNEGPDIFRISGTYPTKMSVSLAKGWLLSLEPYVTDEYKAKFPETFWKTNSGLYMNGEVYGVPLMDVNFNAFRPFFYNPDILKKYGYEEPPKTWGELETMASKITKDSKGQVYGFGVCQEGMGATVTSFAEAAGYNIADAHTTEGIFLYDMKTGMSAANNPSYGAAVNFIKKMYNDNILPPGWETWKVTNLSQQFAAEKIAMMAINGFVAKDITNLNPDINIQVGMVPVPDEGRAGYRYLYYAAEPYFGLGSDSVSPEAAFKLLEFYSSPEFHENFYKVTGRPTFLWDSYGEDSIEPYTKQIMSFAEQSLRIAPYPGYMHKDGEELLGNIMANIPKPNIKEIYNMAIMGDESYEDLAAEYDVKVQKVAEDEIAKMKAKGSDITKDVFLMPSDWDHMKNFEMK